MLIVDRNIALACVLIVAVTISALIAGCVAPSEPDNAAPKTSPAGTGAFITLHNAWVPKASTYRGALHTHTTRSDGALSPDQLAAAYAREGFAFLVVTDHDAVTRASAPRGMLVLPGEEIATCVKCPPRTDADRAGHIVGLNLRAAIASQQPPQHVIDDVDAQGGMALLVHPTLLASGEGFTNATLRNLTGYRFVEVTNLDADSARTFYDTVLSRGTRVWLVGGDDAHTLREVNATASVIVNADRLTAANVITNLRAGNFYVATGHGLTAAPGAARITSITTHNQTITITVPEPSTITWIQKGGAMLKTTEGGTRDDYTVRGDERYVRVEVIPRAHPAQRAWSQPVFVAQHRR